MAHIGWPRPLPIWSINHIHLNGNLSKNEQSIKIGQKRQTFIQYHFEKIHKQLFRGGINRIYAIACAVQLYSWPWATRRTSRCDYYDLLILIEKEIYLMFKVMQWSEKSYIFKKKMFSNANIFPKASVFRYDIFYRGKY